MHTKIWAAVHTPFFDDGSIDFDGIRSNVRAYLSRGIEGIFCNGLFGEGWAVSANERIAIAKTILEESAGRLEICSVATIGTEEETIELGRAYKRMGLNYSCLLTPPRLIPQKELVSALRRQMQAIDMPFVLFNAVTPEGNVLSPEALSTLADDKNLRILKTTVSAEENRRLRDAAPASLLIADPTEASFFENATKHGQRLMFSDPEVYLYQTADFRPIEAYVRLIDKGDLAQAKKIRDALQPLRDLYDRWFLTPFYNGIMTMAYLKRFSEIAGLVGGSVRPPLKPVSPQESAEMEQQFSSAMRMVRSVLMPLL